MINSNNVSAASWLSIKDELDILELMAINSWLNLTEAIEEEIEEQSENIMNILPSDI